MKSFTVAALLMALPALATAYPQRQNGNAAAANTNGGGKANTNNGNANTNANTNNGNNGNANSNNNNGNGGNNNNNGNLDDQTKQLIQTAIDAWSKDTGVVSNFLDNSASFAQDSTTFVDQSNVANSAEIDELTHKQILDNALGNNQKVQQAKTTLEGGAFQLVVDQLQLGVDQGPSVQQDITDAINNDRCIDVLPNIDTYLTEAAKLIGAQPTVSAIRPSACAAVSSAASAGTQSLGFQGNPPPQGAIDALRNGNTGGNSAASTTTAAGGGAGTRAQQSALAAGNANNDAAVATATATATTDSTVSSATSSSVTKSTATKAAGTAAKGTAANNNAAADDAATDTTGTADTRRKGPLGRLFGNN